MAFSFGSPAPAAAAGVNVQNGPDLEDIQTEASRTYKQPILPRASLTNYRLLASEHSLANPKSNYSLRHGPRINCHLLHPLS